MGVTEGVPAHTSAEAEQTTGNTPEVRCGVWSGWREISHTYLHAHPHIYTHDTHEHKRTSDGCYGKSTALQFS